MYCIRFLSCEIIPQMSNNQMVVSVITSYWTPLLCMQISSNPLGSNFVQKFTHKINWNKSLRAKYAVQIILHMHIYSHTIRAHWHLPYLILVHPLYLRTGSACWNLSSNVFRGDTGRAAGVFVGSCTQIASLARCPVGVVHRTG